LAILNFLFLVLKIKLYYKCGTSPKTIYKK